MRRRKVFSGAIFQKKIFKKEKDFCRAIFFFKKNYERATDERPCSRPQLQRRRPVGNVLH